jgi:hypothetical protein
MKCNHCIEKQKNWNEWNSDIQCAFENWVFSWNNWNCWTMDYLREKAEESEIWSDDMFAWLIANEWEFIYLEWYKSRWGTDKCIDMETLQPITLEKALSLTI